MDTLTVGADGKALSFFLPISKRDDEQRMVYGYASTTATDSAGERFTKEALADSLPGYMKFANVREMHQLSAVGKTKEAEVDDQGIWIGAKIVDGDAWQKVKEGVYNGFSVGGTATLRDPKDRRVITGLDLIEISLVDRPCNPECLIEVFKAHKGESKPMTVEEMARKLATADGKDPDTVVMRSVAAPNVLLWQTYQEQAKLTLADEARVEAAELAKANENHDERGRFSSDGGGGGPSPMAGGGEKEVQAHHETAAKDERAKEQNHRDQAAAAKDKGDKDKEGYHKDMAAMHADNAKYHEKQAQKAAIPATDTAAKADAVPATSGAQGEATQLKALLVGAIDGLDIDGLRSAVTAFKAGAADLEKGKRQPKAGDKISFESDGKTEAGPSSGTIASVDGEKVFVDHSDKKADPFEWSKLAAEWKDNCWVVKMGELWAPGTGRPSEPKAAADKFEAKVRALIKAGGGNPNHDERGRFSSDGGGGGGDKEPAEGSDHEYAHIASSAHQEEADRHESDMNHSSTVGEASKHQSAMDAHQVAADKYDEADKHYSAGRDKEGDKAFKEAGKLSTQAGKKSDRADKAEIADDLAKAGDGKDKPEGDYGSHDDAGYADPGYQDDKKPRYPLKINGKLADKRIRAAWNYINKEKNAAKYSSADAGKIKAKIVAAWKEAIDKDGPPSAEAKKVSTTDEDKTMKNQALQALGKADATGGLRKGLYSACSAISLLGQLNTLQEQLEIEAAQEDDGSPMPGRFKALLEMMASLTLAVVEEEVQELLEDKAAAEYMVGPSFTYAAKPLNIAKRFTGRAGFAEILTKAIGDKTGSPGFEALTAFAEALEKGEVAQTQEWGNHPGGQQTDNDKWGNRPGGEQDTNDMWTKHGVQKVHDMSVEKGAKCTSKAAKPDNQSDVLDAFKTAKAAGKENQVSKSNSDLVALAAKLDEVYDPEQHKTVADIAKAIGTDEELAKAVMNHVIEKAKDDKGKAGKDGKDGKDGDRLNPDEDDDAAKAAAALEKLGLGEFVKVMKGVQSSVADLNARLPATDRRNPARPALLAVEKGDDHTPAGGTAKTLDPKDPGYADQVLKGALSRPNVVTR